MAPQAERGDFDISYENCSLQPFDDATKYGASFKKKIVVIDGLDNLSGANGHDTAATILTGASSRRRVASPIRQATLRFD